MGHNRRATRNFFWVKQVSLNSGSSMNTSYLTYKRRAPQGKTFVFFFFKILLKIHFQWEFKPYMHTNRKVFSVIRPLCVYFQKTHGRPPPSTLLILRITQFIFLIKWGWCSSRFFLHDNVQIQQNFTFEFKKHSLVWLVATTLV